MRWLQGAIIALCGLLALYMLGGVALMLFGRTYRNMPQLAARGAVLAVLLAGFLLLGMRRYLAGPPVSPGRDALRLACCMLVPFLCWAGVSLVLAGAFLWHFDFETGIDTLGGERYVVQQEGLLAAAREVRYTYENWLWKGPPR